MVYCMVEKRLLTACGMWGVLMREIHAGFHGVSAGGVEGELCLSIGSYRVSSHPLSFRVQKSDFPCLYTFQITVHESVHSPREDEGFNGDLLPPLLPVLCTCV